MTWICIVQLVIILVLIGALIMSVRKCLDLVEKHEELGAQVEESLDILDECFQRISKTAELPIASDDPIVKNLLDDIKFAKHSILLVANKMVEFDQQEEQGTG